MSNCNLTEKSRRDGYRCRSIDCVLCAKATEQADTKILNTAYDIIKTNKELYYGVKSNIAMSFFDEYYREMKKNKYINKEKLHKIANNAADNFLKLLLNKKELI